MSVTFLTNAKSLAARQRFRARTVDAAMKAQARDYGRRVKSRAVALSQGTLTRQYLQTVRPGLYSRKRAANPAFDAIINRQSGLFAASWMMGTWTVRGGITVTVWNSAPYARFMMGTETMRVRPVLEEAIRTAGPSFTASTLAAKRRAESGASGGGSIVMEVVGVLTVTAVAYGSAAMETP